jgi:hypothetical protein
MFVLAPQDNAFEFFRGNSAAVRCPQCLQLLDKFGQTLPKGTIARPATHDVSISTDGVLVTSTAFRASVLELLGSDAMEFIPLMHGMFAAMPRRTVQFDARKRGTQFENQCSTCGQYETVVGATPVFLADASSLGSTDIARTDLEFGSGDEKCPMILLGIEAARRLNGCRLKGLALVKS